MSQSTTFIINCVEIIVMNIGELTALLKKIEKIFPVNLISVDDAHLWPLVRIQLNTNRKYVATTKKAISPLKNLSEAISFFREHVASRRHAKKSNDTEELRLAALADRKFQASKTATQNLIEKLPKKKYLALCLEKEHFHHTDNGLYAPLLDSLISLGADASAEFLKFSIGWKGDISPMRAITIISPAIYLKESRLDPYSHPTSWKTLRSTAKICLWLSALSFIMKLMRCSNVINTQALLTQLTTIRGQRKYFDKVLDAVQPEAVFMTSYTGRIAFVCAARLKGIPVVDVQHGGMHPLHPLAAHWTAIPKNSYMYLPNIFWCWSEDSANIINYTCGPESNRPITVVGGNPWLELCMSDHRADVLSETQQRFIDELEIEKRHVIVVALQYGPDATLSDHLIKVIRNTRINWRWIFRLHPMGRELKAYLLQALPDVVDASEVDLAAEVPLHILLAKADKVVTGFSTIGNEALAHGIQTIFVHPSAQMMYQQKIGSGVFKYAPDEVSLQEALSSAHCASNIPIEEAEINILLGRTHQTLTTILHKSASKNSYH